MPPMKKPAAILDFGSFPPPPPEAEHWAPDPNSIARPGDLKDERFNRDPYQDARLRAARREHGYHVREDTLSVPSFQGSSATALPIDYLATGQWPQQQLRSYRPEGAPPNPASQSQSTVSIDLQSARFRLASSVAINSTALANPIQVEPKNQINIKSENTSPVKMQCSKSVLDLPTWAGPLELALAEIQSPSPSVGGSPPKSLPPHLRKKEAAQNMTNGSPEQSSSRKLRVLQERVSSLDADFEAACEAARRVSDPTAVQIEAYLKFQSAKSNAGEEDQNLSVSGPMSTIDELLGFLGRTANVAAQTQCYTDFGHHLKVSMLLNMVKDLLEPEFMVLGDKDLESCILKVSSLREHLWQKVYGRGAIFNGVSNNDCNGNGVFHSRDVNGTSNSHHAVKASTH